jgi:hypothetical protein
MGKLRVAGTQVIEEPFPVAEEDRHQVDLHLVDQVRIELRPGSFRAARE